MIIYPVIEVMDLVYAYRFGWFGALCEVTEGVMLRPEQLLGRAFRRGLDLRTFIEQEYGVPRNLLSRLKIMLDHGIFASDFKKYFGLEKTPQNIVKIYHALDVNYGLAYDVPARLYLSIAADICIDLACEHAPKTKLSKVEADPEIRPTLNELSNTLLQYVPKSVIAKTERTTRTQLRAKLLKIIRYALTTPKKYPTLHDILVKFSEKAVEITVRRFVEMLDYALNKGFHGLVPVVQGLFQEHVEECIESIVTKLESKGVKESTIAVGTGGRILSRYDKDLVVYAVKRLAEISQGHGIHVKIHLLGWSSPSNVPSLDVLKYIHSTDSLSARRRAVEGKIYIQDRGKLKLVHVTELPKDYNCQCPACRNLMLRQYLLDPSGARRNDVRIVHNIHVLRDYVDNITRRVCL